MTDSKKTNLVRNPLRTFFILAFLFTWLILAPGVAATLGILDFQFEGTVLTILGVLGPLLAALVVTRANRGWAGVGALFRSLFDWRVKARWWSAAVLLMAGFFAISAVLAWGTSGSWPNPRAGVYLDGRNLAAVAVLLLIGSLGEEPGWRGFALPLLQKKYSPMKATLILTFFWWLWHLPTYWTLPVAINSVGEFGFVAAYGMQFFVLLALGTLCAWVTNGSGGSVLMPVLLHAGWNFWMGAFGQEVSLLMLPLLLLTAIVVGLASRGRLGYRPGKEKRDEHPSILIPDISN